jgi:hypothetical protein
VDVLNILLPLRIVVFEGDVAVLGLNGLLEFASEFLKNGGKVAFLFTFADTPLFSGDLVNEWLVYTVHKSVQGEYGVLRDLSEENFRVIGILVVDSLASWQAAEEINTFAV